MAATKTQNESKVDNPKRNKKPSGEAEEKLKTKTAEKVSDENQSAPKEQTQPAAEEKTESKTEKKAKNKKAAVKKNNSGKSDTAPKTDSEKSKPQEPTAKKTPADQTSTNKDTEEAIETNKAENTEKVSDENQSTTKKQTKPTPKQKSDTADKQPSDKTAEEKAATGESKQQPVSEAIRKMTSSPATLPGQSDQPTAEKNAALGSTGSPLTISAKDIMQKDILWGSPDDTVYQALTKMQQHDTGYMMVGTDSTLEGIVSNSDITGAISPYLRPIFAKWRRPLDEATLQIKIKWIMSRPVHTITLDTSIEAIMENICQFGRRALPVVDQHSKVHGLVTVFDIFQLMLKNYSNISTVGKVPQAPPLV